MTKDDDDGNEDNWRFLHLSWDTSSALTRARFANSDGGEKEFHLGESSTSPTLPALRL